MDQQNSYSKKMNILPKAQFTKSMQTQVNQNTPIFFTEALKISLEAYSKSHTHTSNN